MNSVSFIGNLVADPRSVETDTDTAIASLRVALPRFRNGERDAIFIDVTAFDRQAELALEHLSRGRQVGIDGRLDVYEWEDDDGNKRSRVYVIAGMIDFMGPPSEHVDNEASTPTPQRRKRSRRPEPAAA